MRPFAVLGIATALALAPASRADDDDLAHFESRIRPVLIAECYECHSAGSRSIKGGLRLDTREGLLAGGDSGPAIVPGQPDESLLLAALRHEGPEMPPGGRLDDGVIADFVRWIEQGASDPREAAPASAPSPAIDLAAGREAWAYRRPERSATPPVEDPAWPLGPVDRFLMAGIEAHGLEPAPEADRTTLARRLSFDLTGLPPTPEVVDAFVTDPTPDAYERLVDRWLASPAFGERWGRHWLDLARFGESLTLRGFVLPSAWRYRDEVIRAFNDDRPFDHFVRQQVAGDLMEAADLAEARSNRVATMFLTLGNSNLEEQDKLQLEFDVVDEQIDAIGRVFLGQTIACARCHDHKFDPIPTADYYALAGILRSARTIEHANVSKWIERPLPDTPEREAAIAAAADRIARLEAALASARAASADGPPIVAAASLPGIVVDDEQARPVGAWTRSTHSGRYIDRGYSHDGDAEKGSKSLTFQPELPAAGRYEVRLAYSPAANRATNVPITLLTADGELDLSIDERAEPAIAGRYASLGTHRFEAGGQSFVRINTDSTDGHVVADAVAFLPETAREEASASAVDLAAMEAELDAAKRSAPRPDTYVGLLPAAEFGDERVRIRGNVHAPGDAVPRGFLRVVGWPDSLSPRADEPGRLQLAEWLARADNPLTARVYVNRAWHHLFGRGLVAGVDHFGPTGDPPSHPELLDDLGTRFMERGWSTKWLVRELVTSRAYRLSSRADAATVAADPENRWLARGVRRRLDAECLRDALLAASGELDLRMGGPGFEPDRAADYGFTHDDGRRSCYLPVFRNALPPIFQAFDFADPSVPTGRRDTSTVAPQALYLENAPFVIDRARGAAARLIADTPEADRLTVAFRRALGRRPSPAEADHARRYLAHATRSLDPTEAWAGLFQSLYATPDFRALD